MRTARAVLKSVVVAPTLLAAAVACQTAGIQRAYMAIDASGHRKRTEFFTDTETIWCDVDYSSGRDDLTIDVRIRSTRLWDEARQTFVSIDQAIATGEVAGQQGTGNTAGFQWVQTQPGGSAAPGGTVPYPVGDFVCDVMLEGELDASLPFAIAFPACPVPPVRDGAPCAGWVARGSVCPDPLGHSCTCTRGVWSC